MTYPPSGNQPPYGQQPPSGGQPPYGGGQPPYGGGQPPYLPPSPGGAGGYYGPPPANNLVFAILATIFCCLPLGIVSIVFASQVNSKWAVGDTQGAYDSAAKAKRFAIWSVVLGVVGGVLYGILIAAGVLSTDFSTTY